MYWFYTDIPLFIGIILTMLASFYLKSTYRKYSQVSNSRGMTGADCAMMILRNAGINDVSVQYIPGSLTDHYSPTEKVLRLSESVYGSTSVAALGVAAHECGHAPLKLRSVSVPVANIGSMLSWPLILIGLAMGYMGLAQIGVILFTFVVLFQLITLPVEFDASRRAMIALEEQNILAGSELSDAGKVLRAAAVTYVAALLSSILQLLRLIMLTRGGRRR